MYELKTKQNIMIMKTQPFLNIFFFAINCLNGKIYTFFGSSFTLFILDSCSMQSIVQKWTI